MFRTKSFNQTLKRNSWNADDPPSSFPWMERPNYSISNRAQNYRRKRRDSKVRSFQRRDSNPESIFMLFLKNSSIYVLSRIGNSPTAARKFFWVIILIVGLVGCLSQIGQYLASYYKYPVVVTIESVATNEDEFPSVTLCNLNPIRKDYLPCLEDKKNSSCFHENNPKFTKISSAEKKEPFCDDPRVTSNTTYNLGWATSLVSLSYKTRVKYGHQLEDFITACGFDGDSCGELKETNNYMYGNCFTFNPDGNISTMSAGPNLGLQVIINLELDEYLKFTRSVGARIQVHDPSLPHDIESKGLTLRPGYEHYIKITKSIISRLPPPFSDRCKRYELGDSQKICEYSCKDKVIRSKCFCSVLKHDHDNEIQQCDITNPFVLCCVFSIQNAITCECPLACREIEYKTELSSASWPTESFYEEYKYFLTGKNESDSMPEQSFQEFQKSHLQLRVYYDTLDFNVYKQKAAYQNSELLSMIGGQMGLWLGLSLIAIFECFESIVMLFKRRN